MITDSWEALVYSLESFGLPWGYRYSTEYSRFGPQVLPQLLLFIMQNLTHIFQEVKKCLYPFVVMFMFELFLVILRDIVMIWQNQRWYNIVFVNPAAVICALCKYPLGC